MRTQFIQLMLLCLIANLAFSQVAELKHLDEIVIGPDNVNFKFSEQVAYYEQKYFDLINTLDQIRMDIDLELKELNVKRKRNKKQIASLEITYREVVEEMEIIESIVSKWSQQFPTELIAETSTIELNDIAKSDCYDLITGSMIYSQSEYVMLMPRERISWEEISKIGQLEGEIKKVISQPASTKWEKKKANKDCVSADPNDCLVWCLVQVPPQIRTVITKRKDVTCSSDFTFIKQENKCIRKVSVTNENPKLKFILSENNKEIFPEDLKQVKCQE